MAASVHSMGRCEEYIMEPVADMTLVYNNQPAARSLVICSCLDRHLVPFCARCFRRTCAVQSL